MLSGCGFGTIEDMLAPPRLTDEQQAIYTALVDSRGTGFKLKYPRTGEHRSAFVVYGRDLRNPDCAIVFYEISGQGIERSLRMNFLFKDSNGNWESLRELPVTGIDIESVNFIEFGDDEETFIFLSFAITHNEKAFILINGIYTNPFILHDGIYSFMYVDRFFGRERKELLIIKNDLQSAEATFFNFSENILSIDSTSSVDPSAGEYLEIIQGEIAEGLPAIFIQHRKHDNSENYGADLLYRRRGRLINPMENPYNAEITLRRTNSLSDLANPRDINGDGFLEIPSSTGGFPGYLQLPPSEILRPVIWRRFENLADGGYSYYTFYSAVYDFIFFFPSRWVGSVTVTVEPDENIVNFYVAVPVISDVSERLLSIKTMFRDDPIPDRTVWDFIGESVENDLRFYVMHADNESALSLTDEELEKAFKILSTLNNESLDEAEEVYYVK
jgi:hypothetical protein